MCASSHTPPVPSSLSGHKLSTGMRFGAFSSTPKCCLVVCLGEARQIPDLTSSAKHSYRFTSKGMKLIAEEGHKLLASRVHPDDPKAKRVWVSEATPVSRLFKYSFRTLFNCLIIFLSLSLFWQDVDTTKQGNERGICLMFSCFSCIGQLHSCVSRLTEWI
jgi:hypothetical protein